MGAQNELTADDIANADVVIITADTAVQQDRFEGKPLIKKTVKDGVNKAEAVIREAERLVEGDAEAAATEPSDDEAGEADEEPSTASSPARRGGDREKGLFARLKRLFS
jgi:PTS system fructose-specific IIB component